MKVLKIILGNLLYSAAVAFFIIPNGLITGGTTGIGLFLNEIFGVNITVFVAAFNVVMFGLGYFILGKKFALSTLLSTIFYPIFLALSQYLYIITGPLTQNKMLSTIYAGVLIGVGIGMVIQSGASTGGMDIPPLIFNKKLGIAVSKSLCVFDILILILQMSLSDSEQILYGILLVVLYTFAIEQVSISARKKTQFTIISNCYKQINDEIQDKIDRGSTILKAEGGYSKKDTYVVMSVISKREEFVMRELILNIDPEAFIVVNQVGEVKGRGFSLDKIYK